MVLRSKYRIQFIRSGIDPILFFLVGSACPSRENLKQLFKFSPTGKIISQPT